jgi:hypothetical protein
LLGAGSYRNQTSREPFSWAVIGDVKMPVVLRMQACQERRMEKEPTVKVKKDPAPPPMKESLWCEKELKLQALLACHPDNPEDVSGLRLLEVRSFNKVQPMDDATAHLFRPWTSATSSSWLTRVTMSWMPAATVATSLV